MTGSIDTMPETVAKPIIGEARLATEAKLKATRARPAKIGPRRIVPITATEWRNVPVTNMISQALTEIEASVEEVLTRQTEGIIAFGGSGMGKDHIVHKALKKHFRGQYVPANPGDYRDTLTAFHRATSGRGNNPLPVLFNEAHLIFNTPQNLNVLKMAAKDGGKWWADYHYTVHETYLKEFASGAVAERDRKIDRYGVSLDAPFIGLSNADLNSEGGKAIADHLDAVKSRVQPIFIPSDPYAAWEYTVWLALTTPFLTTAWKGLVKRGDVGKGLPLELRVRAINWFTENVWNLQQVSPRTMMNVVEAMLKTDEVRIGRRLKLLLKPENRRSQERPLHTQDWAKLRSELVPTTAARAKSPSKLRRAQRRNEAPTQRFAPSVNHGCSKVG